LGWPRRNAAIWFVGGLLLAVALHVAASATEPPLGLKAAYFATATPGGTPERSTDYPWLSDATRIEPALDLRGEDFGVHFFNDAARFNFGADVTPGRDQLPFGVRWDGWLVSTTSGPRRFVVDATGPVTVWLDEQPLASADTTVDVSEGLHQFRLEYQRREAKVPALRVQWQREPGGALETVGGADVRWRQDLGASLVGTTANVLGAAAFPVVSTTLNVLALAVLAAVAVVTLVRVRRRLALWPIALALLPVAFAAYGALHQAPMAGKATILSGLDDWLIYESSARDILLNGPLMDGGQGHAAPFYGQPLYPYALAILHRLTGESLFGPIVVQFAALGAVAAGTAILARRCFGQIVDGVAALAFFLVLLQVEPEHFKIARQLFNENLYMPLVMASLIVVVGMARARRAPRWWQTLLVGVLLGATTVSRSQFLLCVPFVLLILAWRRAAWLTALVALGVLAAIVPVTARNWAVSGQFVPISSSGGASLLEFHRPPPGLIDQPTLQNDPVFNVLHLDTNTRTVVEFARTDPGGYVATLLPLGAHSIGLQGRNDPGVYWPLLITCALYVGSFAFKRTRRLYVWPIHAFIWTHLLILMLFEADTYGYRLVMPMYAPMVAVAAQVPLELVRRVLRSRFGSTIRSGEQQRAARFALAGWGALAALALLWQAASLVQIWPDREAALHGLGGAAAHAVETADRVGAESLYVASVDGTPRHFGAGTLPGLRYPWIKWFDPLRSLPLPPTSTTAVYMLSELRGVPARTGDLAECLGPPDPSGEVVVTSDQVTAACVADLRAQAPLGAVFDGVARVDALSAPPSEAAGNPLEIRLLWQPLVAHPEPRQVSVQLDDPSSGDGSLWGNGTLELYPAAQWQTDEPVLSRIPVGTDATALPQAYRLTVGMSPAKPNAAPDLASWQGARTDRVPVASVVLTPGTATAGTPLPNDMRPVEGPPLVAGGLELVAARPLPSEAAVGSPLRVGLLWRATEDGPSATQMRLRLVDGGGSVLQESVLPLLGGRVAPSALRAGNVVRDEQSFVVSAALSGQNADLELSLEDQWQRLGSVNLTGRAHVMDTSGAAAVATFGGSMDLLSSGIDPVSVKAGDKLSVNLRWRAAGPMNTAYKVFVHVLDASGSQVLAQRDSEPLGGSAPTTGWVKGEVLEDAYALTLPMTVAPGQYPIEVGVYDPRSGDRLTLADGTNHLVLASQVTVR
jgi:dolichyl-phosphate-mannose-protein mannosyltransferase